MSIGEVLKWVFGILGVILVLLLIAFPEYFTQGYKVLTVDDGYTCLDGVNVPLKFTDDGNIACLSSDGINCDWKAEGECYLAEDDHRADLIKWSKPLICGAPHAKHYVTTGYDYLDAEGKPGGHWCQKGKAANDLGSFSLWSRIKNAVATKKIRDKLAAGTVVDDDDDV